MIRNCWMRHSDDFKTSDLQQFYHDFFIKQVALPHGPDRCDGGRDFGYRSVGLLLTASRREGVSF